MIKVMAPSIIKDKYLDKAFDIYKLLVNETVKEDGCISYELFQDINNPNHLTLIEEWESLDALNKHTKTSHFIQYVKQLSIYEDELPVSLYKKIF